MATLVDTPCKSVLSTSEIVGLSFIAESGVISSVAVLIFAALVLRNVIEDRRNPGPNGPAPLIRTHVDGYMISLMFADLLQGIGALVSAKWAAQGQVECSAYCTAQGAMQQLGESGVAMSTLVITIHTFATVFFRWQPSRRPWLWMVVVSFIWTFLILFVVLGYVTHRNDFKTKGHPYFGPTPYWCWIGASYMIERIFGEYFWLWSCAVLNIILYPFLFFTLRGNIDVDPGNWRRIRFHRRSRDGIFGGVPSAGNPAVRTSAATAKDAESLRYNKARNREAMKMFWYPISYTVLVLPLTINRWSTFGLSNNSEQPVSQMSIIPTSVVLFIFGLSGLTNVLLFLFTRPNLLLFNVRRERLRAKRHAQSYVAESGISFNHNFAPYPATTVGTGTGVAIATPQQHQEGVVGLHHRRSTYDDDDEEDECDEDDEYDRAGSPYFANSYPPPPHKIPPPTPGSVTFHPGTEKSGIARSPSPFGTGQFEGRRRSAGESSSRSVTVPSPGGGASRPVSVSRFQEHFQDYAHDDNDGDDDQRTPRHLPPSLLLPPPDAGLQRKTSASHFPVPPDPVYSPSSPPPPVQPPPPSRWAGLEEEEERMRAKQRAGRGSPP